MVHHVVVDVFGLLAEPHMARLVFAIGLAVQDCSVARVNHIVGRLRVEAGHLRRPARRGPAVVIIVHVVVGAVAAAPWVIQDSAVAAVAAVVVLLDDLVNRPGVALLVRRLDGVYLLLGVTPFLPPRRGVVGTGSFRRVGCVGGAGGGLEDVPGLLAAAVVAAAAALRVFVDRPRVRLVGRRTIYLLEDIPAAALTERPIAVRFPVTRRLAAARRARFGARPAPVVPLRVGRFLLVRWQIVYGVRVVCRAAQVSRVLHIDPRLQSSLSWLS